MKKFLCVALVILTLLQCTGCVPTNQETQQQKEMKQKLKEEIEELESILEKSKPQEAEETY